MEHVEISIHEVKIFQCVKAAQRWVTHQDIMDACHLPGRTVRQHTKRLVELGVFDQAEVFPRHAYRYAAHADKRNKAYMLRLEEAVVVFTDLGILHA